MSRTLFGSSGVVIAVLLSRSTDPGDASGMRGKAREGAVGWESCRSGALRRAVTFGQKELEETLQGGRQGGKRPGFILRSPLGLSLQVPLRWIQCKARAPTKWADVTCPSPSPRARNGVKGGEAIWRGQQDTQPFRPFCIFTHSKLPLVLGK